MAISLAKPIPNKPTGLFDFRSDTGDINPNDARVLLNTCKTEIDKPKRAGGWKKLFSDSEFGFNNQDLHEQLIDLQGYFDSYSYDAYTSTLGYYDYDYCGTYEYPRGGCREAITHLVEFDNEKGTRKLIAFTQKRIYELNERGGNWRLLADGLGSPVHNTTDENDCLPCSGPKWSTAQLLGYMLMTNGFDAVMSYKMGDDPDGCNLWSTKVVSDLVDLGVSKAGTIAQFKGFILIGDIETEGVREPGAVMWSDFNSPLEWLPLPTSLAGKATVGFSEKILRLEPLGDYLMVYTEKAIYRTQLVLRQESTGAVSEVFHFTEIYRGPHALRFKYSLVNTGTEHIYASVDGIYVINNPFSNAPLRVEWLHKAAGVIYDGATRWSAEFQSLPDEISSSLSFGPINDASCDNFIGAYNALTKEVWWSWPTDDNICPNVSLRVSPQYSAASIVDHGFTAFTLFRSDQRLSLIDWLIELEICTTDDWDLIKQGELQGGDDVLEDPPANIFNATEDATAEIAPDSLCKALSTSTPDDLCAECPAAAIFIGASSLDFTLKEFDDSIYYREVFVDPGYTNVGYPTLIQSGAIDFGSDVEKVFSGITAKYKAVEQTTPSDMYAMAGFGIQDTCPTWRGVGTISLRCITEKTRAQHEAARTRPSFKPDYSFYYRGVYLFYRLYVLGTGGGTTFEKLDLYVRNAQT